MKTSILIVAFLLVGAAVFSFFGQPQTNRKNDVQQYDKTISLFHYFSGSLSGGLTEMVDIVNSRYPEHKVLAQSLDHEAFKSMILTTLAKDAPPELFTYWAGAKTRDLVNKGKLEPIDDIWQSVPLSNRFTTPVTEAASTYNGRKYLLPITQHFVVFFYNKHLFNQENLSAPTSWAELTELAEKLKMSGVTPFALGAKERWPAQFWFDYLLLRTAGPEYRQALMDGKAAYTDQEVVKVYAEWGSFLKKGYFNGDANTLDWAEATELVCSGKAAMTLMGTWALQAFTAQKCGLAEGTGFDFFVFPTINPDVPAVAVGPVDGIILARASTNHEFAKTLLSYFSEIEPQQRLSQGSGAFAPSNEVPIEAYSQLRQRILAASRASPHWAFNYDLATSTEIADKGMDSFNELIAFPDQSKEILDYLQAVVVKIRSAH